MTPHAQTVLLLAVGGVALRLGLTDDALVFVRSGLRPFLVAAGVVVLVCAIAPRHAAHDTGGGGHGGLVPGVAPAT